MAQTTKKVLAASLKKLLEKANLDKITVKDIVEGCQVNRQTFYYHFQDVYDLLEWIFTTETAEAISDKKTYDTWQQGFIQAFHYVEKYRSLVQHLRHPLPQPAL